MKKFENLGKNLIKNEQKKIMGGSLAPGCGCCVHTSTWNGYQCGLTNKSQALNLFDGGDGGWDNWCCDSCAGNGPC